MCSDGLEDQLHLRGKKGGRGFGVDEVVFMDMVYDGTHIS